MAVSDTDVKTIYQGNGSNTDFAIPFDFLTGDLTHIKVYVRDEVTTTYTETLKTISTHYTLIPAGNSPTTVRFNTAPAATDKIIVVRVSPLTQAVAYSNAAAFLATDHEKAMDRLARQIQDLDEAVDRCLKVALGDPTVNMTMPPYSSAQKISRTIVFGTGGTTLEIGPTTTEIANAQQYAIDAAASAAAAASSTTDASEHATTASRWAKYTSGTVVDADTGADSLEYSAKEYALGTTIRGLANRGSAKDWATYTTATVDNAEYSAKEYSQGTQAGTGGSAKDWAMKTSAAVTGTSYSSKEWAIGTQTRGGASGGSAKDWANYTSGTVDNSEYSSKEWARGTQTRGNASGGSAKDWANLTGATADNSEYSAKEYAQGTTITTGSAKDWAAKTSAAVDTDFSSKEYAQGTQAATGGSAKNWSQQTGADVTGAAANSRSAKSWSQDANTGATLGGSAKDWAQNTSVPVDGSTGYSAKEWALGTQTRGVASSGSAKDWANYTGGTVDGTDYSAKHWANVSLSGALASYVVVGSRAAPQDITAAGGITVSADKRKLHFVNGNGGAITITASPRVSAGATVGEELVLVGRSNTNTLTLANGNGMSQVGSVTLGADDMISYVWDGTNWVEQSRSF